MLTLEQVTPFLSPESLSEISADRLTALVNGCSDWIENYTNLTLDANTPQGLCMACADMVEFQLSTRPHLKSMKTEDMTLEFNTSLPTSLTTKLTHYRRLRW